MDIYTANLWLYPVFIKYMRLSRNSKDREGGVTKAWSMNVGTNIILYYLEENKINGNDAVERSINTVNYNAAPRHLFGCMTFVRYN
jgi:hypothetical protein